VQAREVVPRALISSSVRPSLKYSFSGSELTFCMWQDRESKKVQAALARANGADIFADALTAGAGKVCSREICRGGKTGNYCRSAREVRRRMISGRTGREVPGICRGSRLSLSNCKNSAAEAWRSVADVAAVHP